MYGAHKQLLHMSTSVETIPRLLEVSPTKFHLGLWGRWNQELLDAGNDVLAVLPLLEGGQVVLDVCLHHRALFHSALLQRMEAVSSPWSECSMETLVHLQLADTNMASRQF